MESDLLVPILIATLRAATPLLLAALGELITERAGVLNLGLEGMLLVGAVAAFIAAFETGHLWVGVIAGIGAGGGMAMLFGFLVLQLATNQVATGLALTIFGTGLSAFLGMAYVGKPLDGFTAVSIPGLGALPVIGPVLFSADPLVYVALALAGFVTWFLARSRAGLVLRAVGESPETAYTIGLPVMRVRFLALLFGGGMAGLTGAYLSLSYTPMWVENMSAGRGWIALALVVFASWRAPRIVLGALLFGGVSIAQLFFQSAGLDVSSHLISMLPYVTTIVVLVLISRDATRMTLNAPRALAKPFRPST